MLFRSPADPKPAPAAPATGDGPDAVLGLGRVVGVRGSVQVLHVVVELIAAVFAKIVDKARFPEHHARRLFAQVLQGVAHLHARGVCHRDLKPENILLHKFWYTPTRAHVQRLAAEGRGGRRH